ncbi:dockerin type I domain-containing protein [Halococcus sediminicola]|uniref:dockerin type I domain-containing protein n=1 Tax=Halococcus sediminicola TaxID=1264579 RepID=UPI000678BB20|nr:dockerin type I domain-containing protein [Halococcus sediminicola]
MSSAPSGLAGYDITLGLENDSVATITNATIAEEFGLSLVNISEDNTSMTVRLRGLDFDENIEEGATNISLADVEIEGMATGETALEIQDVTRVDDDSGDSLDLDTTDSGQITVEEAETPTLTIGDATVEEGSTTNADVSMSSAPNGLAGYDITFGLENDSVATITNATIPDEFSYSSVNISEDNTTMTVRLRALDLQENIEEGATNISLADVEVEGVSAGETALEVQDITRVDDDSGDPIDVNTDSGQITVEAADGPGDGNATPNLGIRLDREHVTAGDETAASVVLSEAPEGVAGFNMTLGVDGEEVTIVATSVGDSFDLAVTDTDADAAMIRGLDFNQNVQAGAENVTLATAYVRGAEGADGTAEISITDVNVLESDEAETINATTSNATLEVHNVEPIAYNQLPIDADADGLYEDIDGNGEVNRNDAQIFFREFNSDAIQGYDEYDFNQDGKLSYSDIIALRNYM